jgi:hypothetical protein
VLQASRDDAAVQGLYKFWSNRRITPAAILSGHIAQTVERSLQHPTVLTIQDTTELDFSTHRTTGGLGPISDASATGLKVHLTLCSSDAGVPLGILQETVWAREKIRRSPSYRERQTAIAEKESSRWLEHQEASQHLIPASSRSHHHHRPRRRHLRPVCPTETTPLRVFDPRRPEPQYEVRCVRRRSATAVCRNSPATLPDQFKMQN